MKRVPILPSLLPFVLLACGRSASETELPVSTVPEGFYLAVAPTGAHGVLETRAVARPGDSVVVAGRVMDFVEGRAALRMVDASLPACNEAGPMDDCPTPWDFCCDDPAELAQALAVVELRDAGGLVKSGLRGFHGLDHLKPLVVQGTLEQDADGNLTVAATGIHVQ
jgi:hypothetical protein